MISHPRYAISLGMMLALAACDVNVAPSVITSEPIFNKLGPVTECVDDVGPAAPPAPGGLPPCETCTYVQAADGSIVCLEAADRRGITGPDPVTSSTARRGSRTAAP